MPDFEPGPDEPRLESWKAIASYLNRDVRTAKRWEVHEGLPVHRHRHLARSTVYIYPREIDLWRQGRKQPAARAARGAGVELKQRWVLLSAALAMAVLAGGGGRFVGPAEVAAQSSSLTATRLFWPDGDGPLPLGAVSFSGGYLAFNDGNGALLTRDLRSDRISPVSTPSGWRDGSAEFVWPSRGGDVIAYTWRDFTEQRYELRTIDRAGGIPRVLHVPADRGYVMPMAWTPDGARVAALVQTGGNMGPLSLSLFSTDTATREQVIARFPTGSIEAAAVSPDGRWIAYDYASGLDEGGRDIYVVSLDGGDPVPLVATSSSEAVLDWFPDGRHLMYMSNAGGTIGAWAIRVDGGRAAGQPIFVKGDLGRFRGLGFTDDGRFYSNVTVGGRDVHVASLDPRTGLAVGEPKPLAGGQPGVRRLHGTWSPAGDRIAFVRSAPMTRLELAVQHVVSGRTDVIPMPIWNLERPTWHPDGKRIIILGHDAEHQECAFEIDLETGGVNRITDRTVYATYTPDGQYLLYQRPRSGDVPAALVRRKVSDGSEDVILTQPGAWLLSHDGRRLLLYRGRATPASLFVMPAAGGERRLVLGDIEDSVAEFAISADGRYAYYVTGRSSDRMDVWRVAIDGGQPERLGVSLPVINHLSANPDGSSLAISGGSARFETWVWDRPTDVVR